MTNRAKPLLETGVATVLLLLCVTPAQSWSYDPQSTTGINEWTTYYPDCNPATSQQSPIAFREHDMYQAIASSLTFRRIQNSTEDIYAMTLVAEGGLLETVFSPAVHIRLESTNYYVESVIFHTAAEHNSFRLASSMEVQVFLSIVNAQEHPTIVLSLNLVGSDAARLNPQASILASLLDNIRSNTRTLAVRTPVSFLLSHGIPLFNLPNDTTALEYTGSVTFPPCHKGSTVLMLSSALEVPPAVLRALREATASPIRTARPRQARLSTTVVHRVSLVEQSTATSNLAPLFTPNPIIRVNVTAWSERSNPRNLNMKIAIICLTCFCVAMLSYAALLVLARYEVIDLPTWLGGLARRVEWWENPKSARTVVNSDEDEEVEANGEEDEEYENDGEADDRDDDVSEQEMIAR